MRHDVGEVVAAARLQVDVVDRVGQVGGGGDVVAGELEATGRRFDPRREQQGVGPVPGRGRVAGRIERGQDPLRASAVAEHDPGPAEPVDEAERDAAGRCTMLQANAASMLARSARAKARCSAWSAAAHTLLWRIRRRRRTMRRARRRRARTARRRSSLRARTRGCCRAAGSERSSALRRRRRSPANGWRAGRPRRSRRLPARRALRGRTRPPVGVRRQRRWRAPTGPAGRRGTAGRSSTGSST